MDQDPYRAEARRDPKLEKLAAEGRHQIADAAASDAMARRSAEEIGRERNLRAALGAYYGTPLRTFSLALLVVCPVMGVGWIVVSLFQDQFLDHHAPLAVALKPIQDFWWLVPLSAILVPVAIILRSVVRPLASPARVAAERAWARSLPIGFDDTYFDVLASDPVSECRLEIEITGEDALPALDIIQGVVGLVDTKASVGSSKSNVVTVVSGPISGETGVTVSTNGGAPSSILRNDRIVAYVHDFVGKVLLPLHESSPIAQVTFPRDPRIESGE